MLLIYLFIFYSDKKLVCRLLCILISCQVGLDGKFEIDVKRIYKIVLFNRTLTFIALKILA